MISTTGNVQRDYVYFNGRRIAYYSPSSGNQHYYWSDHLGSARTMSNSSGSTIEWEGDYYPFGNKNVQNNGLDNYFLFTGYEYDYELGDSYADFREQSPVLGRFFSPDPYDGSTDLSNPQSLNRYSYVLNNPLAFIDPLGLECVWDDGSYDDASDPETGSYGGCNQAGGTWFDPQWFAGLGLPDWSSSPNQMLQGYLPNGTPDATVYGNVGDLVDALFNQMHQNYIDKMNALNAASTPEQYIQAIANAAPTACGGGVFVFGGVERSKGKAEGAVGGIIEYDSNTHFSAGGLVEGGQHEGPGGGTIVSPSTPHLSPIIYAPVAGPAGMVLFDSGVGVYVGGTKGPFGGGGGAYINFTTNAQCNAWQQKKTP